jgi:hypothetical protein
MERDIVRGGAAEKQTEKLKLFYTNSQSLFGKLNELIAVTSFLEPDVVLITETWTNSDISNASINMPGYRIEARSDRQDTNNGIGGGVIIYVKETFEVVSVSLIDSNYNQHCSIALKTNSGQLNIFLIYRPPNSNAENLNLLCELLEATNPNTVVIGDFNLPCISWGDEKSAGRGRGLLEASMTAGLTQLVDLCIYVCKRWGLLG